MAMTMPLSAIPPVVAATIEQSYGHHRTRWFDAILDAIGTWTTRACGGGTPLILTTTSSGAREAVVANLVAPGDPVWLSRDSAFCPHVEVARGTCRWLDMGLPPEAHRAALVLLDGVSPSGRAIDVARATAGVRAASADALVVLDASVSFGADHASFEGSGVDGVIAAPEGALMGIPGLAIVVAGDRLLDAIRACRPRLPQRPFYLDLLRYAKAWPKRTTPYSPNISAAVALAKAIELIEANGGLEAHVARHAARAASVRSALSALGGAGTSGTGVTNAFTVLDRITATAPAIRERLAEAGVGTALLADGRLRLDHAGYLPPGGLERACATLRSVVAPTERAAADSADASAATGIADLVFAREVAANIPPDEPLGIFEIPAADFAAQATTHARREGGGREYEERIAAAALATFRAAHRCDRGALASRTVGFIGAGNIVVHAVEKCRALGITSLVVYSPSLAARVRAGDEGNAADRRAPAYWEARGVRLAQQPADVWTTAHTIVLLPWFYDAEALAVFGRPPEYLNDALVDASVLERIEREGRADLLINAAARERLVDRAALARALERGWLRYYSDELPAPDDPLLRLPNARFTGHVGGSCAAPQAAVARNTHQILRQLLAGLHGDPPAPDTSGYRVNVVNAGVAGDVPWRMAALRVERGAPIRILITDRFDLEALDLDALRREGEILEVTDVSQEKPTPAGVAAHIRRLRPHVLMVRSRTTLDATVAAAAGEVPDLAAVVRPGVGIDNVYAGLQALSRLGVQVINEPFGNSSAVAELTLHFVLSAAEPLLLAPGPTRYVPDVFAVTADYMAPGRPRFRQAHAAVEQRLSSWLGAEVPPVVLSASGTGLMEAGITNLTAPGDHGAVISHGKFGDRFLEVAEAAGRVAHPLRVDEPDWGRAIAPDAFAAWLRERSSSAPPLAFLCFQQNETSSGIAYRAQHIEALVRAARAHNPDVMVIVDAISGAFAHPLHAAALDVDLLIVGSQKGLGVSSGLAFGAVSRRALGRMLRVAGYAGTIDEWLGSPDVDAVERFEIQRGVRYLSLLRLLRDQRVGSWSDTPSVFHVLSTERAFERHDRDGGRDRVVERHARMAGRVREALEAAGLREVADPAFASDSVTPAFVPPGVDAGDLRKRLEAEYGIAIAGAQGDYWKRQMVRIGHFGFVYPHDLERCLRAIRVLTGARASSPEAGRRDTVPVS